MAPSRIFWIRAWRAEEWRAMSPAAILRFFFSAASPVAENPLHAARVGREVLLHEHIHALLHGIFQVRRAEGGVRGQHRHVAGPQAVDCLPVGVEPQESPLVGHVDLGAEQRAQGAVRCFQSLRERSAMATSLTGPPDDAFSSPSRR